MTNEFGFDECLVSQAQAEVGTADAPVLRETDPWVGRKLGSFDLTSGRFDQLAKLLTLLFGDRSQQAWNLRNAFPQKSHNGDIGDSRDPGLADELEIKRGQPLQTIWITGADRFPFEQTPRAVELANGIDIGHKLVAGATEEGRMPPICVQAAPNGAL